MSSIQITFSVFKQLYKTGLITLKGLLALATSTWRAGINLGALLNYAAKLYPNKVAVICRQEKLTYNELLTHTKRLATSLVEDYQVMTGKKVAIISNNHASIVKAIFSVSYSGADMYLLNAEMSQDQFAILNYTCRFDLIIYDPEIAKTIQITEKQQSLPTYHATLPSVDSITASRTQIKKVKKQRTGKIIVLTGGTTGNSKTAARKPSIYDFLAPFSFLLDKLHLNDHKSVYIATPVYHGFGLATLLMSIALGKQNFLLPKFHTGDACTLIHEYKIDVITLVPLMLSRMLQHDPAALQSLNCIVSGGAHLDPKLVATTNEKIGPVLYNLYGTSECGVCIAATPGDLQKTPGTIGKVIAGVRIRLLDADGKEINDSSIGRICIQSKWSAKTSKSNWACTGDLGYKDKADNYYLCGRIDDMIVSGGENVYPVELENILMQHNSIKHAAVIGINDDEFGQRLKAFIVPADNTVIHKEQVHAWLHTHAARFQMPKFIEFIDELPYTPLGKLDKKKLV